ncbi:hypothetical protein Unana1_07830 [Umbelopsis nana]
MTVKTTIPPPVEKNSPADPFSPFTGRDFRTATIENHWNDPPTKIFTSSEVIDAEVDSQVIHKIINETTGMQKRMIDDTARRMTQLLATIDEHGLANDILHSLCQLCQAMEKQDFQGAAEMQIKMVTKAFDNHGQWIVGLKRLIELDEKIAK